MTGSKAKNIRDNEFSLEERLLLIPAILHYNYRCGQFTYSHHGHEPSMNEQSQIPSKIGFGMDKAH